MTVKRKQNVNFVLTATVVVSHLKYFIHMHCVGWISITVLWPLTTPTLLGKVEQWREFFAIRHPWPGLSKLTKEWVGTRLHRVDARGGGILQEMAHKVDCLWGCSRSEYLVGEEKGEKKEKVRRGRGRERERKEEERGHRERLRVRKRSWKSIKLPGCALFRSFV